jgi:hypothetical protein
MHPILRSTRRSLRARTLPCLLACACVGLALVLAGPARAQAVAAGSSSVDLLVSDGETGLPLQGAVVRVDGVVRAVSDSLGHALVSALDAGRHQLEVRMVGRGAVSPELFLAAGQPLALEVVLDPEPVALPDVSVTAAPPRAPMVTRLRGGGFHVAGPDIRRSGVRSVSELIAMFVSSHTHVSVSPLSDSRGRVSFRTCAPALYIDRVAVQNTGYDVVPVQDLDSVDIYTGVVPAEYGGTAAMCGVIVLHTRAG